jgi:lysozyme family protein
VTEEQLIDDVFKKEGDRYGDRTTKPPIDQPTARGGIILATLQAYYDEVQPGRTATVQDLKDLTHAQARDVVRWKLRQIAKRAKLDAIAFDPLRFQMVDFAYNSGEGLAIRWLQRVLRVPRTGRMDAATIARVAAVDPWLAHQALIAARLQMIDLSTDPGGKVDRKFEEGLENRALTFSLLEVP